MYMCLCKNIGVCLRTCTHTYIHCKRVVSLNTYIHTYIHTYIYVRTYIHTYTSIHTYVYTYIYMHTYVHKNTQARVHTCYAGVMNNLTQTRMYIHAFIHTGTEDHPSLFVFVTYMTNIICMHTHTHTDSQASGHLSDSCPTKIKSQRIERIERLHKQYGTKTHVQARIHARRLLPTRRKRASPRQTSTSPISPRAVGTHMLARSNPFTVTL
jgi:hypothetical protein